MFWPFNSDNKILVEFLRGEIDLLRQRDTENIQRIDRLMEALSRKANIDLIMPQPVPPVVERQYYPNPWKDPNLVTDKFEEIKK